MRIANAAGRLVIVVDEGVADVERVSGGLFDADPRAIYPRWTEFQVWAATAMTNGGWDPEPLDQTTLGAPSPAPAQVFAIGLNYGAHALEAGFQVPEIPLTFTKFPSCISGPYAELPIPGDCVDWEVELVVVIGAQAQAVAVGDAWRHVAGLTVGQDYSERQVQTLGESPQFSLGKSFPGFGPTGPWLVTVDEFDNPDDLELQCLVNGELMQSGRTLDMILPVANLISRLSMVCPLLPGDLIFTGTPDGVGSARTPPRYLKPGDEVVSRIEGIGTITQHCVPSRPFGVHLGR